MTTPIIGITRDENQKPIQPDLTYGFYAQSVTAAGGEPRAIVARPDTSDVASVLDGLAGILFSGGNDLNPNLFGQKWHAGTIPINPNRQRYELALLAEAERRRMPILGICLGCQLLNVHRGGSLIQFLPEQRPGSLEHRKLGDVVLRHDVTVEAGSLLHDTLKLRELSVNTYHKQAIDGVGRGLRVVAHAPDGVIEGIEDMTLPLFLGVQWHPERISAEAPQAALFALLVARARAFEAERQACLQPA